VKEVTISSTDEVDKLDGFGDTFAFDVETRDEDTKKLTADWYNLEVFLLSLYDGEISVVVDCYNDDTDELLQAVFDKIAPNRGQANTVIAHNIPFDIKALHKHDVSLYNADWFDTLIAHHLLDERKKHGLKHLAKEYFDADVVGLQDSYRQDKMSDTLEEYARKDTVWPFRLADRFWPKLCEEDLDTLFKKVEMPFQRVLVEMEENGVKFNKEKAERYRKKLSDQITNMEVEMCDLVGIDVEEQFTLTDDGVNYVIPFNWASNKQLRELLYDELELETDIETDAGKKSVGEKALKSLKGQHEVIDTLLEYKTATQLKSNFFDVLPSGERGKAKIFTYGILYGAQEYRIMNEFGCTEEEAKEYLDNYFDTFSGIKDRFDEIEKKVQKQGYIRTMYGRKRRFSKRDGKYGKYYPPAAFRQAKNHTIQGASSDMMRVALIKTLNYKHNNPEYGLDILMTVHDEAVVECNEEYAETVAEDIEDIFASVVGDSFVVDMPAHSDIGDTYAAAK